MNKRTAAFALAVVAQVLILIAVPAQKIVTRATGRSVLLKIRPVDPFDILSGYYVTLNYEIAARSAFSNDNKDCSGDEVYALLEAEPDGAYRAVYLSPTLPAGLGANQIALRGRRSYSTIRYGIEQFFIPETKRGEIEQKLREHPERARAEIKVDARGNAALVRLLIGDSVYDY